MPTTSADRNRREPLALIRRTRRDGFKGCSMDDATGRIPAETQVGYYADKPLNEIEEDIARTRVRLSGTIEALERELAPDRIVEKSAQVLRDAFEPPPDSLRQQVWVYSIPLALIAAGLGWLFLLRRRIYQLNMPAIPGQLPAEAIEAGETPVPAPSNADVVGPVEPVSPVDEKTAV
jgi:hypothetical protein